MNYLLLLFILASAILAIYSAVRPVALLWIAVILLCVVEAVRSVGGYLH